MTFEKKISKKKPKFKTEQPGSGGFIYTESSGVPFENEVGITESIIAGVGSGAIKIPKGFINLGAMVIDYFGEEGMLGYVAGVQRKEIRQGIACVKHQNMAGSDMGDDHKEYFAGEAALKASGKDNTMNQF